MKPQFGILNSLLLFLQEKHKTLNRLSAEIRELQSVAKECQVKFELLTNEYDYPGAELRACISEILAVRTTFFVFKEKVSGIYDNQHSAYNTLVELKSQCEANGNECNMDMSLAFMMDDSIQEARDTDVTRIYAEWTELSLIPKLHAGIAKMDELIADETHHNSIN